jgi:ABC-type lipoprotein export system ATPase subunit/predicted  nucleic acid-binding Zn-ribbon protein
MIQSPENRRGAQWNKWDLHVHTPASVEQQYGDAQQTETWDNYITALEALPPEIKVVAINDYFTLAGYRRILAARKDGRIKNLALVLPAVELRIASFVGHSDLRRLNFHVLFSDELSPDTIENFFLHRLSIEEHLAGGAPWLGCVGTEAGLISLGEAVRAATPVDKRTSESSLRIGFRSAAVPLKTISDALAQSVFTGKHLTALGVGEWSQMRWDGAGAVQKRDAIERVDLVLTASSSLSDYQTRREQLRQQSVNSRIFHASDAHYFATSSEPNRLGRTLCWIKADLTFRGLRRAIARFEERVYVGEIPPKLERVNRNKTKYIRAIEIHRKPGSPLGEAWFDSKLELSSDLVAIIGNQGSGKSALTDVIALCGNSKVNEFSFLTSERFCDKQKKAAEFHAILTWEDDDTVTRPLDARVTDSAVERVRYVPQGFFEAVTNETAITERGRFYGEIKKAIFSHVAMDDRLGATCLDDLVAIHTSAAADGLTELRRQLSEINRHIVALESACAPLEVQRLREQVKHKQGEIASLEASPPEPVAAPAHASEADADIERLRGEETGLADEVHRAEVDRARLKRERAALHNAAQAFENEERRVRSAVEQIQRDLRTAGVALDVSGCLTIKSDYASLQLAMERTRKDIDALSAEFDLASENSLASRTAAVKAQREEKERQLNADAAAYQAYKTRFGKWQAEVTELRGEQDGGPESLVGLQKRLKDLLVTKPALLRELEEKRRTKCREIHDALSKLAQVYTDLTRPVQQHIGSQHLTRDRYRIAFNVLIAEQNLEDQLFTLIGQSAGTYGGVQAGRDRLRDEVSSVDFSSADQTIAFTERLLDQLKRNHRATPPVDMDILGLLKKGAALEHLYDLIFSLEYLAPTFALALNGKPLRQLSPGERGILLLVFYLVVDQGEEPLIVDQPEGNLNNQSIVDHLVPVFMAAKERRQVIIVTHNPNLAVVCDAEQIIHCELDIDDGYRLYYDSGALENPKFNKLSLDVLDGTAVAFEARRSTYDLLGPAPSGSLQLPVFDWPG